MQFTTIWSQPLRPIAKRATRATLSCQIGLSAGTWKTNRLDNVSMILWISNLTSLECPPVRGASLGSREGGLRCGRMPLPSSLPLMVIRPLITSSKPLCGWGNLEGKWEERAKKMRPTEVAWRMHAPSVWTLVRLGIYIFQRGLLLPNL